jgi:putative mRNA 3-end processing factor
MQIEFFGGAQEVGKSAIMLHDGKRIMLDYGIKVGATRAEYPKNPGRVDGVILSHAHLDHSGAVPVIYNDSFVPTFGTAPTMKLSELLLNDSLEIARKEHYQPRFHKRQISSFMNRYISLNYGSKCGLGDFSIEMHDAGHICGSAVTLIERTRAKENKRIVYTGDFKLEEQYLHKGAEVVKSDVLITESTYAIREHPNRNKLIAEIIDEIRGVLDNGGTALVPVFAVGRSQEMLTILHRHRLTPVTYMDGMARAATSIITKYPAFIRHDAVLSKAVEESMVIKDKVDRRNALNEPSIILTTAGMLNGGPVLNYITKLNKNSKILLTGYQVEGTNGATLLAKGYVVIDGNAVRIKTPAKYYDLSAHASKTDLYNYVKQSSPQTVICVHGSPECATDFAENLKLEGFDAHAPKIGDVIKLP